MTSPEKSIQVLHCGTGKFKMASYPDKPERGLTLIALVALGLLTVANIFQLTAVGSNHWVHTVSDEYGTVGFSGLWQICTDFGLVRGTCRGFQWTDNQVSHWFRTVQTLEVLGLVFGMVSLFMMLLKHFVETCFTNRWLRLTSIGLLIMSFLFILSAGCVIGALKDVQRAFEIESTTYMAWSFALSIVGCIFYLASSIALVMSIRDDD